jgi:DNA polymerase V
MQVPIELESAFRTVIEARKLNLAVMLPSPVSSGLRIPLYSNRVKAGFPSPADDYVEAWLSLDEIAIEHKEATFFLHASGDSMIGEGILDGNILIVDKSLRPKHGDIVIAVVDGDFTVKRLEKRRGKVRLVADNPAYPPIEFKEGQELIIWGVVVGTYRGLKR